ncbi:hypothetical protein GCM10010264_72660 [Streptomyces globisporus]|nr:hypothetical protein GCM10010264_72660 [Streptomyces globisporus]
MPGTGSASACIRLMQHVGLAEPGDTPGCSTDSREETGMPETTGYAIAAHYRQQIQDGIGFPLYPRPVHPGCRNGDG